MVRGNPKLFQTVLKWCRWKVLSVKRYEFCCDSCQMPPPPTTQSKFPFVLKSVEDTRALSKLESYPVCMNGEEVVSFHMHLIQINVIYCHESALVKQVRFHLCSWYLVNNIDLESVVITLICHHPFFSIHIMQCDYIHLRYVHQGVSSLGHLLFPPCGLVEQGTETLQEEKEGQTSTDSHSCSLHAPNLLLSSTCHTLAAKWNWLLISFLPQVTCDSRL